jgi:hypothetical protein
MTQEQPGMASMVEVFNFFSDGKTNDYKLAQFRKDWGELSEQDKVDLRSGVGNGSFTY